MAEQKKPPAFETHGYSLDPTRAGYQVVTNYESMYWRALVGNEAWGLYEVLRSFCHEGKNICYPSIALLMDVLRIADRRTLIGRVRDDKKSKGLLQVLEGSGLLQIETRGEDSTRYLFHVRLDPGQLTDDQINQLPKPLKRRHQKLIATHAARRDKKPQGGGQNPRGVGHAQGGVGHAHPNNNNITIPKEQKQQHRLKKKDQESNNNNTDPKHPVVVVALNKIGFSRSFIDKLLANHSPEYLQEKLGFLEFLGQENPQKVTNPRGWLRRAIEDDYGPPDGFLSTEEQEQKAREEEQKEIEQQHLAAQFEQEESRRQAAEHKRKEEQDELLRQAKQAYGTAKQQETAWHTLQERLRHTLPNGLASMIDRAQLLAVSPEGAAVIGVWDRIHRDYMMRLEKRIIQELADAGTKVKNIEPVLIAEAATITHQ
jgi:hypothetical protein